MPADLAHRLPRRPREDRRADAGDARHGRPDPPDGGRRRAHARAPRGQPLRGHRRRPARLPLDPRRRGQPGAARVPCRGPFRPTRVGPGRRLTRTDPSRSPTTNTEQQMSRIRSLKATYGILLVALSSLAVAACGGDDSTKGHTSKAQTQPAGSGYGSSPTVSRQVSIRTGVHVTNTPTKAFRV